MSSRPRSAAFAYALAAMLALVVALQIVRDRAFAANMVEQDLMYVTSGEVMKRAALSYDAIAADVYWIRALQHFGGERQKAPELRRFDLLYPLLDLTTTLDPLFTVGYRFGAIFLAEAKPGGAGRPKDAIALLEKGIKFNPAKWDYYYDVGFIYYWHLHDYERAAEWFDRGGKIEGAPWWLRTYAAVMLTRGGDRQASRAMWVQIGAERGERVAAPDRSTSAGTARCARQHRYAAPGAGQLYEPYRSCAHDVGRNCRRRSDSGTAHRPGRHTVRNRRR